MAARTGKNYTNGMTLDYGTQVRVKLSWKVPNEVKVQQGTTFTYDLPQGIAFENGATYPMYDSTGKQRGTFTVQDNKVVATYTDTTDASSGINAYVTIDGKITRSADNKGNGGERDWNFPGIGNVETTINPEHGLDIHKNGAVNTGETDADGNSVYYYVLNRRFHRAEHQCDHHRHDGKAPHPCSWFVRAVHRRGTDQVVWQI